LNNDGNKLKRKPTKSVEISPEEADDNEETIKTVLSTKGKFASFMQVRNSQLNISTKSFLKPDKNLVNINSNTNIFILGQSFFDFRSRWKFLSSTY